jgi:hypothetical protein
VTKVCSPDEPNQDDPEEWIPIRTAITMQFKNGDQNIFRGFHTDPTNQSRRVNARRVYHSDTSIDDRAKAAYAADPTRRNFVVDEHDYQFTDGTQDKGQFVEAQVVVNYSDRSSGETGSGQGTDLNSKTAPDWQFVIDATDPAQGPAGSNGYNPPWALDPYQAIINLQFGGATEIPVGGLQTGVISGAGTSSKVTLAMWVRLKADQTALPPTSGKTLVILDWGSNSINVADPISAFYWRNTVQLSWSFAPPGAAIQFGMTFCGAQLGTVFNQSSFPDFRPVDATPVCPMNSGLLNTNSILPGKWCLIAGSIDTHRLVTGGSMVADQTWSSGALNNQSVCAPDSGNPALQNSGTSGVFPDGSGGYTLTQNFLPFGSEFSTSDPPFDVVLGGQFNVPVNSDIIGDADFYDVVDYGPIMIWKDLAIDFQQQANIDKFVVANPNVGSDPDNPFLMIDPAQTFKAFGNPTIYMKGSPAQFLKDTGNSSADFAQSGPKFKRVSAPKRA